MSEEQSSDTGLSQSTRCAVLNHIVNREILRDAIATLNRLSRRGRAHHAEAGLEPDLRPIVERLDKVLVVVARSVVDAGVREPSI